MEHEQYESNSVRRVKECDLGSYLCWFESSLLQQALKSAIFLVQFVKSRSNGFKNRKDKQGNDNYIAYTQCLQQESTTLQQLVGNFVNKPIAICVCSLHTSQKKMTKLFSLVQKAVATAKQTKELVHLQTKSEWIHEQHAEFLLKTAQAGKLLKPSNLENVVGDAPKKEQATAEKPKVMYDVFKYVKLLFLHNLLDPMIWAHLSLN